MARMEIRIKRAYARPAASDGRHVLVDRLWPRGIGRESARIDYWARDLAPSSDRRRWFGHDPERWEEFRRRYFRALQGNEASLTRFRGAVADARRVTLVFAAREGEHSNAAALAEYLHERF